MAACCICWRPCRRPPQHTHCRKRWWSSVDPRAELCCVAAAALVPERGFRNHGRCRDRRRGSSLAKRYGPGAAAASIREGSLGCSDCELSRGMSPFLSFFILISRMCSITTALPPHYALIRCYIRSLVLYPPPPPHPLCFGWRWLCQRPPQTEHSKWSLQGAAILAEMREKIQAAVATPTPLEFLPPVHILDLHEDGYIKPHVDSIKFSGGVVAGLSLLSDGIMRSSRNQRKPLPT